LDLELLEVSLPYGSAHWGMDRIKRGFRTLMQMKNLQGKDLTNRHHGSIDTVLEIFQGKTFNAYLNSVHNSD
jgi:hypothetical protein